MSDQYVSILSKAGGNAFSFTLVAALVAHMFLRQSITNTLQYKSLEQASAFLDHRRRGWKNGK